MCISVLLDVTNVISQLLQLESGERLWWCNLLYPLTCWLPFTKPEQQVSIKAVHDRKDLFVCMATNRLWQVDLLNNFVVCVRLQVGAH